MQQAYCAVATVNSRASIFSRSSDAVTAKDEMQPQEGVKRRGGRIENDEQSTKTSSESAMERQQRIVVGARAQNHPFRPDHTFSSTSDFLFPISPSHAEVLHTQTVQTNSMAVSTPYSSIYPVARKGYSPLSVIFQVTKEYCGMSIFCSLLLGKG